MLDYTVSNRSAFLVFIIITGADLEISKGGGFFLLLWLAGHSQPHPLSIVFLAKGGVLPNFENNRRTPLDPLVNY